MRLLGRTVTLAQACLVVAAGSMASMASGATPSAKAVEPVPAPEPVCAIQDDRLAELSGLAADDEQWYAVNDGGTSVRVFVLDRDCTVRRVIESPTDPYDIEDMALAADGTLWLGDTGDNSKRRDTVALHAVRPDGRSVFYRLTYPDGQHDAEALLLDASGTPYILTKDVLGDTGIYRPAAPLARPGPTPMERVGSLSIEATDTAGGPVGSMGSVLVTGAAATRDRTVFAVRTYTDVYLYPAPDGDVPRALSRPPIRIPLPGERQGEALAFEPDGTLLSASEGLGEPISALPGAAGLVVSDRTSAEASGSTAGAASNGDAAGSAGLPPVPALAIAILAAAGAVFGLRRLRRGRKR